MLFLKYFSIFFLLLFFITLADYYYLGKPSIGIDDANIFLNYANHFAHGDGFVYNINGEKVEGFTSMLWVLICAGFYSISSHPETLLIFFLLILSSITITLVYQEVSKDVEALNSLFVKKYFAWLYSGFIICIGPSFVSWSVLSLMENGVWNFVFISIIILVLKIFRTGFSSLSQNIYLLSLGILLILTRPEGVAWGIFFTALIAWSMLKNKKPLYLPAIFFLVISFTAAGLTYFRLHYFGYPLPNTYYAKVSDNKLYNITEGCKYAINFITSFHPVITFSFITLVVFFLYSITQYKKFKGLNVNSGFNKTVNRINIVSIIVFVATLLPLSTGGDHFGGYRFYQGILLLFVWSIPAFIWLYKECFINHIKRALLFFCLIIILFFLVISADTMYSLKNTPNRQLNFEFQLASEGRAIGEDLNAYWGAKKPSVGVIAAGGFALMYKGNTVDLMGLNNTMMGHSPGDRTGIKNHAAFNKDVFYKLNTDLTLPKLVADGKEAVIQYAGLLNVNNFENEAMKNIFNDSLFQQKYQPVMITKNDSKKNIFAFASSVFLSDLKKDSSLIVTNIALN